MSEAVSRLLPVEITGPAGRIEGLLQEHEGVAHQKVALVCHPHPLYGGTLHNKVTHRVASTLHARGAAVLRFNFRGVGASQGERGDRASRVEDSAGALRLLRENTGVVDVAVAAVGGSAETAVRLVGEHPGVVAVALVSPPPDALTAGVCAPFLCIVGEHEPGRTGLLAAATEAGGRVEVVSGADARFQRNLPEVGRVALRWLEGAGNPPES